VLAVIQVALEGRISRKAVEAQLARGHRSAGDLIPWTLSQQFDSKFAQLSGARIVRVAVHPSVQGMGYGSRAMELLFRFYNGEMVSLTSGVGDDDEESEQSQDEEMESDDDVEIKAEGIRGETLKPRKELPPLLLPLTEVDAPRLDWVGTSFGLTLQLHKFWSRAGMQMLYLRQTQNDLTGEHSAIMLRALPKRSGVDDAWLSAFLVDFRRRFISLLGGPFRDLEVRLAVSVLEGVEGTPSSEHSNAVEPRGSMSGKITVEELDYFLSPHDLKRLELYGRNLCDHHLVTDLLPTVGRLYFTERLGADLSLSSVQAALLCGIGLQNRSVDGLSAEFGLPANQILAMFNKAVRKLSIALNNVVIEKEKGALLSGSRREEAERTAEAMRDVAKETLEEDVAEAAKEAMASLQAAEAASSLPPEIAKNTELLQYAVKGSEKQWQKALEGKDVGASASGTVQIQSVREKRKALDEADLAREATKEADRIKSSIGKKKKSKKKKARQL
jgi:N-acetyltransferase 10